jgi:hypothetical protein
MTYTLIALFLATGQSYTEREGLSLQSCAGRAAMARMEAAEVFQFVGDVRYLCVPERSLARKEVR